MRFSAEQLSALVTEAQTFYTIVKRDGRAVERSHFCEYEVSAMYEMMEKSHSARNPEEAASSRTGDMSNSARAAVLGIADTPPDTGLGDILAARIASVQAAAGLATGSGVVQMKRPGEPDHGGMEFHGSESALRRKLEDASGVSLRDVKVNYDSDRPARIGALAYARGNEVFMGPGQEKYLPHEMTHVVQQKQGLVRPTGTVGGMPVNTSEALETAADHMSAAPVGPADVPGTPAGGVVQGVFKTKDGRTLGSKEVDAMVNMVGTSYDTQRKALDTAVEDRDQGVMNPLTGKRDRPLMVPQGKKDADTALINTYRTRQKTLQKRFRSMMKSRQVFDPEDVLHNEFYDTQTQGGITAGSKSYSDDVREAVQGTGTNIFSKSGKVAHHNTREAYDQEAGRYKLADTVMEGVEIIPDYDPAKNKGEVLLEGRMGNSGTLSGEDIDAFGNATPMDPKKLKQKKNDFAESAEVARKAAVSMRKPDAEINFGTIWNVMSKINATANKGERGGKLRGDPISASRLIGTGAAQLPETVFRTFSTIADQINQIKKTRDRDLQKSQAIKLASFALQMTISKHMFSDGNGRSSRLLADAILQAFGLPPHTPLKEQQEQIKTLGEGMDFDQGAASMLQAVQKSSKVLAEEERDSLDKGMFLHAPGESLLPDTPEKTPQEPKKKQGFFSWLGNKIKSFFGFGKKN